MIKYLDLPVGKTIIDYTGVKWKRTNLRNLSSTYDYRAVELNEVV